jgi:putative transposase
MSKKRHTRDARIRAIREHESGQSWAEVCRQLNITTLTFYRWKKQLGMMTNPDAQRLRALEKENKEFKQMVADLLLEKRILKVSLEKKTLSPRALRELLPAVLARTTCSERRACRILGLHRNTARYLATPPAAPRLRRPTPAMSGRGTSCPTSRRAGVASALWC